MSNPKPIIKHRCRPLRAALVSRHGAAPGGASGRRRYADVPRSRRRPADAGLEQGRRIAAAAAEVRTQTQRGAGVTNLL